MNQKNLAYWIGTDVRRGLAPRDAHMFPGPGTYDNFDSNPGPFVGYVFNPLLMTIGSRKRRKTQRL